MITIEKEYINSLSNLKFIDLFAGIGGLRLGMESFGAKCMFSSEIDSYAIKTYSSNFNDTPHGDITQIMVKDIPEHDMLLGGFPCQSFSISGLQKGFEDARGTLFFDVARIIKHRRPRVVLLENVNNLEKHDDGRTLNVIVNSLENLGYSVFYKVLNASHFGVPQSRKRIYIACFRNDLYPNFNFEFPKPTMENIKVRDISLNDEDVQQYIIKRNDIIIKENYNQSYGSDYKNYKPIRIGTISKGGQGERIYDPNGHAITLSAYGGGVAAKTGAYLVNNVVRKLAPRECARLMGFPDSYKIVVPNSQALKQFGNSVVVNIIQLITKAMIDQNVFAYKISHEEVASDRI